MEVLSDLLYKAGIKELIGSNKKAIEKITFDSRAIQKNSLFIAIKGTQVNGHNFIEKAIENGATAVLCQDLPKEIHSKITYIRVENSSKSLGQIASNFYYNPSSKIKLIGITGTNGKTTTVNLLFQVFRYLGYGVGMFSTVENKINDKILPATHTTPDPIEINRLLSKMIREGCTHCFMEVSSHALIQNRIEGLEFAGGIFSNITHDHLDYHKTFKNYISAKKIFFDNLPKSAFALVNKDDKNGLLMVQNSKAKIKTYAQKHVADFKAKILENTFNGLMLKIDKQEVFSQLIGSFNVYNILATYATAILLDEEPAEVLTAISAVKTVSGRFDYIVSPKKVIGIIDYAHTPDALKNVLKTINSIKETGLKVITVVGCGGDRDKSKRPKMAQIACDFSDKIILTSDNPRTENPEEILKDMFAGIDEKQNAKTLKITNRKEAIRTASFLAHSGLSLIHI